MEIGAIGVSGSGVQQQPVARAPQQQEYPNQERVRQQASSVSEVRPSTVEIVRENAPQAPERNAQAQSNEQPKVFVNAQGQKTGTIISVTA